MLFNEPKLLKSRRRAADALRREERFSALQRAEIAEIATSIAASSRERGVSVLFNEPKLLKCEEKEKRPSCSLVSVLFNEPKLLKFRSATGRGVILIRFQCSSTSRNC